MLYWWRRRRRVVLKLFAFQAAVASAIVVQLRRPLPQPFFCLDAVMAAVWRTATAPLELIGHVVGYAPLSPTLPSADLSGRIILITGANTGIGKRTAANLAKMGATVVMAVRSLDRGASAVADIKAEGGRDVSCMHCDLSSLASVRDFAGQFKKKYGQLDVLINNAGLNQGGRTQDGYQQLFAVNFLGHFHLTTLLMDLIERTPNSKVVNLSSVMHHYGSTEWEAAAVGGGSGFWTSPYSDSKLAAVLFTQELRRRFQERGLTATAIAVNPGAVRSDIWRGISGPLVRPLFDLFARFYFLTPDQGSFTSVCAATWVPWTIAPEYMQPYWLPFGCPHPFEVGGPFLGCRAARPSLPRYPEREAKRLWKVCQRLVAAAESKAS